MTLFHAIRRRHQINSAVRELSRLDDDLLQDIGIDRANIAEVVATMIDSRAAQSMDTVPARSGYAHANYTAAGGAAA